MIKWSLSMESNAKPVSKFGLALLLYKLLICPSSWPVNCNLSVYCTTLFTVIDSYIKPARQVVSYRVAGVFALLLCYTQPACCQAGTQQRRDAFWRIPTRAKSFRSVAVKGSYSKKDSSI